MLSQDLEFSITQYLDGTLAPQARADMEKLLRENPQAALLLEEYKKLDALIVRAAGPLPNVDWKMLGQQISLAVADADRAEQRQRVYRIGWMLKPGGLVALAASLLIAIGATAIILRSRMLTPITPGDNGQPITVVMVTGPQAQTAAGNGVAEVSLSAPPQALAQDAQDVVARRSHITIEAMASADGTGFGPR